MTTPRDPDELLAAYLAQGMETLPDRVVDAVLDEIHRTRQRSAVGPWRTRSMSRTAYGAAAVVAVLVIGGTLYLTRPSQPAVGGPNPTPGPSSTPSESASPAATPSPPDLSSPSLVEVRAPSWTVTGSMMTSRSDHTATLLPDGKVLVAGGITSPPGILLASAELYDPVTGAWTSTGAMSTPRYGHAATLLSDGKVLAVGGFDKDGDLASAELFDPSTGTWATTGNMGTPRRHPSVLVLPDGRVLVAGGEGLASAEVYDPVTGAWTETGSMHAPRYGQGMTLLPDGKVLVAGGATSPVGDKSFLLDSAELYDPATGAWTATGTMVSIYSGSPATLLPDGRVLVGGFPPELYDPGTGSWTAAGSKIVSWWHGPAALLTDGHVLVLGAAARGEDVPAETAAAILDPVTGSWSAAGTMKSPHVVGSYTATLLPDGRLLVAGGSDGNSTETLTPTLADAELYDPGTGR